MGQSWDTRISQLFETKSYPAGVTNIMKMKVGYEAVGYEFQVEDGDPGPSLPLQRAGSYETLGWDIPNYWAIDAKGQAWQDASGHGFGMTRCTVEIMLQCMEQDATDLRDDIRRYLGMKPVMPEWMKSALASGWTPPTDFDRNQYE